MVDKSFEVTNTTNTLDKYVGSLSEELGLDLVPLSDEEKPSFFGEFDVYNVPGLSVKMALIPEIDSEKNLLVSVAVPKPQNPNPALEELISIYKLNGPSDFVKVPVFQPYKTKTRITGKLESYNQVIPMFPPKEIGIGMVKSTYYMRGLKEVIDAILNPNF